MNMEIDVLRLSTDWAKAEVFSAKMVTLLSVLVFLAALGFWQLGKTAMAKAFVWPLMVTCVLTMAIAAGLYFTNKPRILSFETAYKNNPDEFIRNEIARTAKSQKDLATIVFKVLPTIIIVAALLVMLVSTPLWRAIGITTIALMACLMFIDSNTAERNANYHQQLLDLKQ
jgi:ABC-2 type transport system permease protein